MNEPELLSAIASSIASGGFQVDSGLLAHAYITLKSKPLVILSSPPGSGKSTLVQSLARVLVNDNSQQFQSMIGHAWWAGKAGNVALLTEAQTRLNTGKFMLLVDEAGRPKNAHRLYIACLNKISPAEVSGFFSEVAFQIQHERLMRLPSYHFTEPLPYPRNLIVIGTMDSDWRNTTNDDFHRAGSVITWQAEPARNSSSVPQSIDCMEAQALFLKSRVNDGQAATVKLASLWVDVSSAIQFVGQIVGILDEHGDRPPVPLMDHAMIYLANAWSNDGCGLFAKQHQENLEIALDSLVARELLQPVLERMSEPGSRIGQLKATLGDRFAQAHRVLDEFGNEH